MPLSRHISEECLQLSSRPTKLAIVGFGDHARRNVLPILKSMPQLDVRSIVVRNAAAYAKNFPEQGSLFSSQLDEVLGSPDIEVVYIATPIETHFAIADQALGAGKHVWVEKPMTSQLQNTQKLLAKARQEGRFVAEISMYQYHRQFKELARVIAKKAEQGERVIAAQARFSIPELDPGNIRYRKDLGGGALLDVGFYPLSAMIALFGSPLGVASSAYFCPEKKVDLSGNALLEYDGFAAHCIWAIGSAYHNEIVISFERSTISVPRAFSKPADLNTEIGVLGNFGQWEEPIKVPPDDHFVNNFTALVRDMRSGHARSFEAFSAKAEGHARILDRVQEGFGLTELQ